MDFRLKVFISVAHNLNFTKAARELHISQPAISKHIQELETGYGVQLFERRGNRVSLTTAGELFLKHAETITESYHALKLDMNLQSGTFSGVLRIGASTTIAQYILPELIAKFIKRFADIRFTMYTGNSEQTEHELASHRIDVALVESSSRHSGMKYTHISKDELVMVTSTQNKIKNEVTIEQLKILPLVLRENGSGTLEVIEDVLLSHNLKLSQMNILLQLGSTESIKSFLLNCPSAYAIISVSGVAKELINNTLKIVDINEMIIEREFAFVTTQGAQNELAERFMQFVLKSV